ncbi:Transferrin binding protein-like solute binding protein [Phocoenobacter uteri]|uniref:Transferrin binding protein-like solute binding protein n=1 Tax=Phocoenobacter uteri TaxID=146806 RepID=A0A379C7Q4_9PAST|nr:Slam-dependent surface lipoprotein [Phocoenobacter uteri]MDG6882050.1 hypothetical protein [Phocoenobacter uteri]SUB58199.1 Transferrin binding protein-like solute binding protein [Phocoenobacter uteri]
MKKLALVTAISLILTACGSGGGSSSADNTKPEKIEGVLFAYDFLHPVEKESKDPAGNIITYDDYEIKTTRFSKDDDINHILINNVSIPLNPNGDEKYTAYYQGVGDDAVEVGQVLTSIVSDKTYKHMRFGQHSTYDYDPNYHESHLKDQLTFGMFVQGYVTENMPTSGTVTYKGDAYGGLEALTKGKSKLDVDFGHKTLKGTLSDWQNYDFLAEKDKLQTISFDASIEGNKFEGKNVKGSFFGRNADEIGGIYHDEIRREGAVFGAKKQ